MGAVEKCEQRCRELVETVDELFAVLDFSAYDQGRHLSQEFREGVHDIRRGKCLDVDEPVVDQRDQARQVIRALRGCGANQQLS